MYGLESIRAINATAAARAEDESRRAKGQKPASTLGKALRRTGARVVTARPATAYAQGRHAALA